MTTTITPGNYYLEAPNGTYWACNTGLTPCISAQLLNAAADYCVLVQLWPRITYHSSETILNFYEGKDRYRREPLTLTLAILLGIGGIAAGIGTGTSALLQSNQLMHLQAAVTADLEAIEKSISALEKSLTSLSRGGSTK